jgi:hypothetical protein
MYVVKIDITGVDTNVAREWVNELANVYADMDIEDVDVSGNKISFRAGLDGVSELDDDAPRDIGFRVKEYLNMNESFQTTKVSVLQS